MFELAEEYLSKLRSARQVSSDEQRRSVKRSTVWNLQTYPFTALELSTLATEEQVADVFVRINSKGTPLNQADFILTLMSVFWDQGQRGLGAVLPPCRQPATRGPGSPSTTSFSRTPINC